MTGKSKLFEGIDFSDVDALALLDTGRGNISKTGAPLIPMNLIIEDPDQPRQEFDADTLNELAESIRERGVLQPITVRPANPDGFHVIVMGARRYRASKLAGQDMIPALVRHLASDSYDQMIENIQREALSHRDIATFIRDQLASGAKKSTIAKGLGKSPAWVTTYADFFDMDPAIQAGINDYGTRAAYELHSAMQIDEGATRDFLGSGASITKRSATEFHQSLKGSKGEPSQSVDADVSPDTVPARPARPVEVNTASAASTGTVSLEDGGASATPWTAEVATDPVQADAGDRLDGEPSEAEGNAGKVPSRTGELPAFAAERPVTVSFAMRVRTGERTGRLVLDREAVQGMEHGIVVFDDGTEQEARLSDLNILEFVRAHRKESGDA